ncbi:dCTP deaminase [Nitrospina gracilis]|uniref:dCTP deaminase n=1 Tax=Nitrospina gracilis TaxID=35801 RepID=UPI001F485A55|nr:hypothetical protein [Nitrospina gracilis]MCF8721933.1 dCTP deaminase [Nitrospina gracilis Nb-211]
MILSGDDIHKALADGRMIIDPAPPKANIDTTSIDLHLGEPLWIWKPEYEPHGVSGITVNPEHFDYREFSEQYLIEVPKDEKGCYHIEPKRIYLGSTYEKVEFPPGSRLAGRVEGKSRIARLGLMVHMTAPMIHCGTGLGIITLEMLNHGPFVIEAKPGETRICQLVLEEVTSDPGADRSGRQFHKQKDAKG